MSRAAFMAGVQHAAAMLREAESIRAGSSMCAAAIEVEFLAGMPQRNFVAEHLRAMTAQPDVLEGFAAVLSDYLSMDDSTKASYYAKLREDQMFMPAG